MGRTESYELQRAACKYLLSICDVCRHCKEQLSKDGILIGARCRREDITGGCDMPQTLCSEFRADDRKIDEVLAHRKVLYDGEIAAISSLRVISPEKRWQRLYRSDAHA